MLVPAARCAPHLDCSVCHQPYGAHVQCCAGKKCYTAFHPLCVRHGGLPYVALDESDFHSVQALEAQLKKHVPPHCRPRGRIVDHFGVVVNGIRLLAFCNKHRSCADFGTSTTEQRTVAAKAPPCSGPPEGMSEARIVLAQCVHYRPLSLVYQPHTDVAFIPQLEMCDGFRSRNRERNAAAAWPVSRRAL